MTTRSRVWILVGLVLALAAALLGTDPQRAEAQVGPVGAAGYVPLSPARILDSRNATEGDFSSPWGPGQTRTVQVGGRDGVPASDVRAVALQVTTVAPTAAGTFLTIWPTGEARPKAASINVGTNADHTALSNNLVIAKVDASGQVNIYNNQGSVHLVIDVAGYYTTTGGSSFVPTSPTRVLDTRNSTEGDYSAPWGEGQTRTVQLGGRGGVPASGVDAVAMHVTTVTPTAAGTFLTAWPTGEAQPRAASMNVGTNAAHTALVNDLLVVKVNASGQLDIYNNAGSVDLVIDVVGYYTPSGGAEFVPVTPARVLDTRNAAEGYFATPFATGQTRTIQVAGEGGLPRSLVEAVALHVTTVSPEAAGTFLTAWPSAEQRPNAASMNVGVNGAHAALVNDLVISKVAETGTIDLYNNRGNVHVVVDVVGYFVAEQTVSISGTVLLQGQRPSRAITVCATGPTKACVETSTGDYTIEVTPTASDSYRVFAYDQAGDYAVGIYEVGGATGYLSVAAGQHLTDVDIDLARGGRITGTVHTSRGHPFADLLVCGYIGESWTNYRCALTAADGTYSLGNFTAGSSVNVGFFPERGGPWITKWWPGSASRTGASTLVVGTGVTSGIDISIEYGNVIYGTVTDSGGSPLEDIIVCAVHETTFVDTCVETGPRGEYGVGGISRGNYFVEFIDPTGNHAHEYYPGTPDRQERTALFIDGWRWGVDATLDQGAVSFRGRVNSVDGSASYGTPVCVSEVDRWISLCTSTNHDGTWESPGLAPGTYRVRYLGGSDFVATEYYDNASAADALEMTPAPGTRLSELNARLDLGGVIAGTVADDATTSRPTGEFFVCAIDRGVLAACTTVNGDTSYRIPNLRPGWYKLAFFGRFYPYKEFENGRLIQVRAGQVFDAGHVWVSEQLYDSAYSRPSSPTVDEQFIGDGINRRITPTEVMPRPAVGVSIGPADETAASG